MTWFAVHFLHSRPFMGTGTEWPAASAESQIRRNFRYTGQIAASKPMNEIILSVPLNRANTL